MEALMPRADPSPYVQLYIPRRQAEALLRLLDGTEAAAPIPGPEPPPLHPRQRVASPP